MFPASSGHKTTILTKLKVDMYYNVLEFKSFHESQHRLAELEEAKGELLRVFEAEGQCIAVFSWGAVSLPLEVHNELAGMVGHEIAVLRLDGKIHIRGLGSD